MPVPLKSQEDNQLLIQGDGDLVLLKAVFIIIRGFTWRGKKVYPYNSMATIDLDFAEAAENGAEAG